MIDTKVNVTKKKTLTLVKCFSFQTNKKQQKESYDFSQGKLLVTSAFVSL